ncbi:hypothetical protein FisN_12Hh288 [Fistulifera solaris]|uniref:Choline transporter-like protein n=1 Tax=Fistulifera solaris TaxID=1519565 RepID=A0A1Z5KC92_FISSO|nr:hypothetical protein FisN_12Hh288 [Fistulifera solaris]|eukprot:GAX23711.1 hypothetical protein FisN_12Hh288 [Fistulifera solaris]
MSNVPIIQGVSVSDHTSHVPYHAASSEYAATESTHLRPTPNHQFQDVMWAVAFYVHLLIVVGMIFAGLQSSGGITSGAHGGIIFTVSVTGVASVGFSIAALSFMMKNAESLVQTALYFSVASSLAVGIVGFMAGSILMGVLGLVSFAIGICYARMVWSRIPFAAVNLKTALSAVQQNLGLTGISFVFTGLAFVWTLLWFLGLGNYLEGENLAMIFFLFLSYYWVHQVLQNTMHVTTAGTVATWWFVPDEATSWFSQAQRDSLYRALTSSFGSICFGSFLVAIVQALRALEQYTRDERDYQFLTCIIQCILACIESFIEYVNRWAYVYIGMYGFSYLEAGKNVVELFQNKGWTVVITDDLAANVLSLIALSIGLASGIVGLVLGYMSPNMFVSLGYEEAHGPAFFVGLLVGFLFSSVILSVVGSAINTVIVCYAEDPAAFQANHPQLATAMQEAWIQAWPGISMV